MRVVTSPDTQQPRPKWVTRRRRALEAIAAGTVASAIAGVVLGMLTRSPRVPLIYSGDELAGLAHVIGVDETGWWFNNPRLGAPFQLEHYDFPQGGDGLQVFIVRVIGLVTDNPALIMNLYFLMTFALVAAVAHLVMRQLGFSTLISAAVATLYSLLPFHFWHGTPHIYRSGYFAIPVAALFIMWIGGHAGGLWRQTGPRWRDISLRWSRLGLGVFAIFIVGTTDTVAAAFAPTLAGVVGLIAVFRDRDPRPFIAGLAFGIGVIAMVIVANVGTFLYVQENGANDQTVQRDIAEQEIYALKLSRVVLPSENHRIAALAELGQKPLESRIQSEGGQALGIIGVIGMVAGVLSLLRLSRRDSEGLDAASSDGESEPQDSANSFGISRATVSEQLALLRMAGSINLTAIIFAVPGGLAFILTIAGFEEIRTWNRIIVYIGFFAFIGVAIGLTLLGQWLTTHHVPRWAQVGGLALVVGFGVFDQTPSKVSDADAVAEAWATDASFFAAVEAELVEDADPMLYTLPNVPYPEPSRVTYSIDYQHARAILHTERLEVSYGAMRGRPESLWQLPFERLPVPVALDALAAIGFDGVYIDAWAVGADLGRLEQILGDPGLSLGRNRLYRLGDREAQLVAEIGQESTEALASEILYPGDFILGSGFHTPGRLTNAGSFAEDAATFRIEPLGEAELTTTVVIDLLTAPVEGTVVELAMGDVVIASASSNAERQLRLVAEVTIPEGGLELRLLTNGAEYQAAGDPRRIQMAVVDMATLGPVTQELIAQLSAEDLATSLAKR